MDSPGAIASYVGVIPRIRQSGKKRFTKRPAIPLGNDACAKRSSWWFYIWCGVIRGCGSTTNAPGRRQPGVAIIASLRKVVGSGMERDDSPQTLRGDNASANHEKRLTGCDVGTRHGLPESTTDGTKVLDSHRQKLCHQQRRTRSETCSYRSAARASSFRIISTWRGIPICV